MNAKKCDRCGKFYIPYHLENGEYYIRKEAHTHNVYESCDTTPDLCPDCLRSLWRWFEDVTEIARENEPPVVEPEFARHIQCVYGCPTIDPSYPKSFTTDPNIQIKTSTTYTEGEKI